MLAEDWNTKGILDVVVLEQFIAGLLAGTAEWDQCHQLASLDEAIQHQRITWCSPQAWFPAPTFLTSFSDVSPSSISLHTSRNFCTHQDVGKAKDKFT